MASAENSITELISELGFANTSCGFAEFCICKDETRIGSFLLRWMSSLPALYKDICSPPPWTSFMYVPMTTVKVTAWKEWEFEFISYFPVEPWGKKRKLGRKASVYRERMAGHIDDWCKGRGNAPFHDNFVHFLFLFPHLNYREAQHVAMALVRMCTKLNILIQFWRKSWWVIRSDRSLLMLDKYWSLLFNLTVNLITLLCFSRTTYRIWKSYNMYWTSSFPPASVSAVTFFISFSRDSGTVKTNYDMKINLLLKRKKKPGYFQENVIWNSTKI